MEQIPLVPGAPTRRPWERVLQSFRPERRELAARVFRAQWAEIERKAGGDRRTLLRVAHRYVAQAERNPASVSWAQNKNARGFEEAGRVAAETVRDLGDALDELARRRRP